LADPSHAKTRLLAVFHAVEVKLAGYSHPKTVDGTLADCIDRRGAEHDDFSEGEDNSDYSVLASGGQKSDLPRFFPDFVAIRKKIFFLVDRKSSIDRLC
jgi:hypothetical protein